MPKRDIDEPKTAKLLRDMELPKWMKSRIDIDDPKAEKP